MKNLFPVRIAIRNEFKIVRIHADNSEQNFATSFLDLDFDSSQYPPRNNSKKTKHDDAMKEKKVYNQMY